MKKQKLTKIVSVWCSSGRYMGIFIVVFNYDISIAIFIFLNSFRLEKGKYSVWQNKCINVICEMEAEGE